MRRAIAVTVALMLAIFACRADATGMRVLGDMRASQVAKKLRDIGEVQQATKIEQAIASGVRDTTFQNFKGPDGKQQPWQFTNHAFGFIPPSAAASADKVAISEAGNIVPDST